MNRGIWYAVAGYACWGLFPLYWKMLRHVAEFQLLCHRIVWSFILLSAVILFSGKWKDFAARLDVRGTVKPYFLAAMLIGVNWLLFLWSVNNGFVVEASLGYFINPLITILLGVVFLGEKLRPLQWLPVGLVAIGILYMTLSIGSFPWIALTLACSFGSYGLVKKLAPLNALFGLTLETGLLFIPGLVYLLWCQTRGYGAFLHADALDNLLMVGAGPITVAPLLLFAAGARLVPLSLMGILQYISPTLQFLAGVFIFQEPFTQARIVGFSFVWLGLLIFTAEGIFSSRTGARLNCRHG